MIEVADLTFDYNGKVILDNISFSIAKGKWVSLIGANGSGKTTLMKIILGLEEYEGKVKVGNRIVTPNSSKKIRDNIGAVLANIDNGFIFDTPFDELMTQIKDEELVYEFALEFGIFDILKADIRKISMKDKHMVALAVSLAKEPNVLIVDESFFKLTSLENLDLINFIKKYTRSKKITVINITHNEEHLLICDQVILLNDAKVAFSGTKRRYFNNAKAQSASPLDLPFTLNLSRKLKFYNLLEKDEYDIEKMVDIIWK